MNYPQPGDYIDIHTHGSEPVPGIFIVETLMAHEGKKPVDKPGITFITGIHPWYLDENNHDSQVGWVEITAPDNNIAAIGEAGFDSIRGPSADLQRRTFEEQVHISEKLRKPMVIHCVRAWDELLHGHKRLRPQMPWLVHGFRGKPDLARQLVARGMYLSLWFEFVMRPEVLPLLKSIPRERIFLETDGTDIDIRDIYNKVSGDLGIHVEELKAEIFLNYLKFFNINLCAT